jgi:predicted RNase H-like HicB family nuclease
MDKKTLHTVIYKDAGSDQWVALCLELDVVTQGDSEEHARAMLEEAVAVHIEEVAADDLDLLFQPIEGEPRLQTIAVSAPALLN